MLGGATVVTWLPTKFITLLKYCDKFRQFWIGSEQRQAQPACQQNAPPTTLEFQEQINEIIEFEMQELLHFHLGSAL